MWKEKAVFLNLMSERLNHSLRCRKPKNMSTLRCLCNISNGWKEHLYILHLNPPIVNNLSFSFSLSTHTHTHTHTHSCTLMFIVSYKYHGAKYFSIHPLKTFYYRTITITLFKKCNIGTLLLSNMLQSISKLPSCSKYIFYT